MRGSSEKRGVESIGERLRRLRLERGVTQRDIAQPGVSYAYISRIEAGTRHPSVKALRKLARKLSVSAEYLETGVDLAPRESREIRLRDAELELRLTDDTSNAERVLESILREAETECDVPIAARARAALGLAALHRGEYRRAIAGLETAIGSGTPTPARQPELYEILGRAYAAAGEPEKAVALFERCLTELEEGAHSETVSYVRLAIYLCYALADSGELARAREVLERVLEQSEELVEPYMRVRLYWSQARLAAEEHDPHAALENLRRAVALLEATEDTRQLGRAHVLWAEILTFEGEAVQAEPHLASAEHYLGSDPDREDLYWLRAEQARCAAGLGRAEEAIARAKEALDLMGDSDPREQGTAQWALAAGLAAKGDIEAANDAFHRAVELLSGEKSWREAAKACRDWGAALRDAGRVEEALVVLDRATELATRGAPAPSRHPV